MQQKNNNKIQRIKSDFKQVRIGLASPDLILQRSSGEVIKPETINYRTFKPEMGGLFCEKIFGPTKDYECHCGKYKRIRYKGIICDRCGVEVTEKKVRRERTGHINLVIPVAHIWYFKSLPNKIGYLLGLPSKKLDLIVYYERYIVIQAGVKEADEINYLDFLTEEEYLDILDNLPKDNQSLSNSDPNKFIAKMGAEALKELLSRLDLDKMSYELRDKATNETSQQRKNDALKRLKVIESFRASNKDGFVNNPEWMILKVLPVIPPELRPLVPLDGGRFATSDLNELYRRVIIRNNRLKRLLEIRAPEVILRNEKRMLQESVDALIDNSRRANAVKADGKRPLKSLSDNLKGKQGRFRQNLLGKRVDYSGRSVIVVGPHLKMNECGLPKGMAAELFKPFIIRKLIERGIVKTVKSAKKIIDKKDPVIWDILENVLKGHPVLLNRAPTLHRLGIQAFQPKLIEGKAIRLHPLTCTGFNADFDGDQMAVHVPLGNAAILEAHLLMIAPHNILNPANGSPISVPSQDMVLGLYYLTKDRKSTKDNKLKGEGSIFYGTEEVEIAYNEKKVDVHAIIKVKAYVKEDGKIVRKLIETTVGRVLFNKHVPTEFGFINATLTKKNLRSIISDMIKVVGLKSTAYFLDEIKHTGFQYAFLAGISFNIKDVAEPSLKKEIVDKGRAETEELNGSYQQGIITDKERYNQVIDVWTRVTNKVTDILMDELKADRQGFNPIYMMLDSGARGSRDQIKQLGGMRGLMAKPQKNKGNSDGSIIENPILANFKEGLSVLEYFISTHGARKGLADTALKTADAGYLTRRLHDVAQDVIVVEKDCDTLRGINISAIKDHDIVIETLFNRILGRTILQDVYNPKSNELIATAGTYLNDKLSHEIEDSGIDEVEIRSALTCETIKGVCAKCYGRNMATNKIVQMGEAVGVIAAQSIGEPGTQLTLRTFHIGGAAGSIEQENQLISKFDGNLVFDEITTVKKNVIDEVTGEEVMRDVVVGRSGEIRILDPKTKVVLNSYNIPYSSTFFVADKKKIKKGDVICQWDPFNAPILTDKPGKIVFENLKAGDTFKEEMDKQTGYSEKIVTASKDKTIIPSIKIMKGKEVLKEINLPVGAHIVVNDKETVVAGEILAKMARAANRGGDITGGLPRVTELFEARNPSNTCAVSEIDGIASFGTIKRGKREVIITAKDGEVKKYLISLSSHILIQEGDYVKAGKPLSDGVISPHDILRIEGPAAVQRYILNGIQEVYRLQGVRINDKHIEVIGRQMMQKMEILEPGDTKFLEKETIQKWVINEENNYIFDKKVVTDAGESTVLNAGQIVTLRQVREENSILRRNDKKVVDTRDAVPAVAKPMLMGITKAALGTDSFLSAASFQETTKVLNEAAIAGKIDRLRGLKENVIVGHLIPAGTGSRAFQNMIVGSKEEYERMQNAKNLSISDEFNSEEVVGDIIID